jgi:hypothetical protein
MCQSTRPRQAGQRNRSSGPKAGCRPGRLIELRLIDLPGRHASSAEQEGQRDRATYLQHLGRPHVDGAESSAGLPFHRVLVQMNLMPANSRARSRSSSSAMQRGS